jgi:hypothetical protein
VVTVGGIALGGTTADGEAMTVLALEMPPKIPLGVRRLTQEELERVHLEKYRIDFLLATGALPFDDVTRGSNPPDFLVSTPSRIEGVECAALTIQKRRDAFALFDRFRARLLKAARHEPFPHLRDCAITVRFGDGMDLPPRAHDEATVERFVEVLRNARIDRAAIAAAWAQATREGFPKRFPVDAFPIFPVGEAGEMQIDPVEANTLQGNFAQETGFDVQLNMSLMVKQSEVQDEFERVVRKHDARGVDRLILSVSAPNHDGFVLRTEGLVVEQLPPVRVSAKHIETLTIHNFDSGAIRDL